MCGKDLWYGMQKRGAARRRFITILENLRVALNNLHRARVKLVIENPMISPPHTSASGEHLLHWRYCLWQPLHVNQIYYPGKSKDKRSSRTRSRWSKSNQYDSGGFDTIQSPTRSELHVFSCDNEVCSANGRDIFNWRPWDHSRVLLSWLVPKMNGWASSKIDAASERHKGGTTSKL